MELTQEQLSKPNTESTTDLFVSVQAAIYAARELHQGLEDEAEPYKNKYTAAEDLLKTINHILSTGSVKDQEEIIGVINAHRGIILLDTDLLAEGNHSAECALQTLANQLPRHLSLVQECCNSLGALESGRGNYDKAVIYLEQAKSAYNQHRLAPQSTYLTWVPEFKIQSSQHSSTIDKTSNVPESINGNGSEEGALHEVEGASEPNGKPSINEGDNAMRTTNGETLAIAIGSIDALAKDLAQTEMIDSKPDDKQVEAHVERLYTSTVYYLAQVYGSMGNHNESARYCGLTLGRQLDSGEYRINDWVQNAAQLSSYYNGARAWALAEHCCRAASACASLASAQASEAASSSGLDEDVAANVEIAWARTATARLTASYEVAVHEEKYVPCMYDDPASFPEELRFTKLNLPAPNTLPWGESAIAVSFEEARDLFNAGMTRLRTAMKHYILDGWVTEHVGLVLDVSNMYRLLAGFERDPKRILAMHKLRAAEMEGLVGILSPQHYLGLVRSLQLELGHVHRAMAELKQGPKAMPSYALAAQYYTAFLASYTELSHLFTPGANATINSIPSGPFPRLSEDDEPLVVSTAFTLGRVAHHSAQSKDGAAIGTAVHLLEWACGYVAHFQVTSMKQEASLARELISLLREKWRLLSTLRSR